MDKGLKELTQVEYSLAAVKVLHFNVAPYSTCFSLHWHDRIELIRVKNGRIRLQCYNDTITLNEGEVILFSPNVVHGGVTEALGVEYDVLMFDLRMFFNQTEICEGIFSAILDGSAKFETVIGNRETVSCVDRICNGTDPDSLEMISLVYRLLFLLFETHLCKIGPKSSTKIKQIIDYMEENYMLDLSTATLSKEFNYCGEHFCRIFKQAVGIPPMMYLRIYRLQQSLKLLESKEYTIGEIAIKCGFNDGNYFSRCFKAHFGVPPRDYNKSK